MASRLSDHIPRFYPRRSPLYRDHRPYSIELLELLPEFEDELDDPLDSPPPPEGGPEDRELDKLPDDEFEDEEYDALLSEMLPDDLSVP